jgi:DNA modification methylase
MAKNAPEIQVRNIADLKPYDDTARVHSRAKRRKMNTLLRRFGQLGAILIDERDQIIDGHLVADTLKGLGETEVKVVVIANRDPAEIKAIRLAVNRLAMEATWDTPKLKRELEDLLALSFDMELTGFDTVEIDQTLDIDDLGSGEVEDAPPPPSEGPAIAQPGDIWLLGEHRVACGDCRDPALVARLMAGASAQMVFTDPPYNVAIGGFVVGAGRHREFACASGEMNPAEFADFLTETLTLTSSAMADGAIAFVCMDWRHLRELLVAVTRAQLEVMNLCIWSKGNAGMGAFYRSQHELVFVLKKGDAPHINNFELGQKGRSRSNVWTYRGMNSFGAGRDELLAAHPTVKPVALVADAIKDVSHRGGIVLDPFLGSGTTVIAANRTGRRCYGLELDPAYVDVIIRRWEAETGGSAVHADTGDAFDGRSSAPAERRLPLEPARLLAGPAGMVG